MLRSVHIHQVFAKAGQIPSALLAFLLVSRMSSKSSKSTQQPTAMRVAVRCAWSGARLAVPASSSDSPPVTSRTNLAAIVSSLITAGSLSPSILNDEGATLVYARTAVSRDKWEDTTLGDLVGKEGGSGGVMLVLNLGGGNSGGGQASLSAVSAPAAAAADAPSDADAAASAAAEPMDIDATAAAPPPPASSSAPTSAPTATEALTHLLSSNFDADLRPCLVTLLKILDNIIAKPHEPKVRTIKLNNAAFAAKVGRCRGAIEVLECCGFVRESTAVASRFGNSSGGGGGGDAKNADADADVIVLPPNNEDAARLISMRHLLAQKAVQVVGMEEQDLPRYKGPPRPVALVGGDSSSSSAGTGGGNRGNSTTTFDPYKTHSYNAQAAASGAADPHAIGGGNGGNGISRTEKELHALKSKQERLERKLQKLGPGGRALAAFRPGSVGNISVVSSPSDDHGGGAGAGGAGGGKSDGSLLAARMKRLEEERRKREEGGFTTKAMRDLESMKKAKVYTHATLRVGFADGCWITAKFLPSETVEAVKTVLREECFREDVAGTLAFYLYVAPPRRKLDVSKRLDVEGLVPAARVHVSWKVGRAPPAQAKGQLPGCSYLREELFRNDGGAGGTAAAFPNAQKLVDDDANAKKEGGKKRPAGNGAGSAAASAESREEALMARMLGKKPGLLGGRSGGDASKKKSSGGKPKWFK